jgi:hypothetical protein
MRVSYRLMLASVMLFILVVPSTVKAESPQEFPNMVGNWVDNEYKVYLYTGFKMAQVEFRIKEQDGPHFRGVHVWKHVDNGKPLTTKNGKLITGDTEPFVGVIGFDGKSITIAEQDDTGVLHGKLVGKDTMLLIYEEPGANAMVFRLELKRKP